eukprot:5344711-Amphidinium_carterae.2
MQLFHPNSGIRTELTQLAQQWRRLSQQLVVMAAAVLEGRKICPRKGKYWYWLSSQCKGIFSAPVLVT